MVFQPMLYYDTTSYERTVSQAMALLPRHAFAPFVSTGGDRTSHPAVPRSPQAMRQQFIISAALGCVGFMHWPDMHREF